MLGFLHKLYLSLGIWHPANFQGMKTKKQ
jgi:hypothetical protein